MVAEYDVFLSHATNDKPAVKQLAQRLLDAGLKPFLDEWDLIPGEPVQEALEKALDNSRSCAVCIGPGKIGPWQNEEMRSALEDRVRGRELRVIPLMLPGTGSLADPELPRFLRRLLWVDFSAGVDNEGAFKRLLAGIHGQRPGPDAAPGVVPESDDPPPPPPVKPGPVRYAGKQKLNVCDRLGGDWRSLADLLEISTQDQARFPQGDEARKIWEWLEIRGRLGELPGALSDIGRGDLAEFLKG